MVPRIAPTAKFKLKAGRNQPPAFSRQEVRDTFADMHAPFAQKLKNTVWLGLLSTAVAFLYLGHQVNSSWGKAIEKRFGSHQAPFDIFLAEFLLAAVPVFICSGVGFFLSERYRLPGLGDVRHILKHIPLFLLASIVAMPLAYFLHDRIFILGTRDLGWPAMIPEGPGWSFAFLAYSALFKEVIFRFGLLTMIAGFFRGRHPWWAVGAVAAFTAGLSMRELTFAGHVVGYDLMTFSTFLWALLFNAALGAAYIREGLWVSMTLRVCIDFRFVLYGLLGYL